MSQDVRRTPPWVKQDTPEPEAGAPLAAEPESPPATKAAADADDATVGTGSVIALGCIAGTVLLIIIGLIFIGIVAIV